MSSPSGNVAQGQSIVLDDISKTSRSCHRVAIALGSNLGDRFSNIESALRLLEVAHDWEDLSLVSTNGKAPVVVVVNTSFLYETKPMYITDQPTFINCACLIETNIEPRSLLHLCKKVESVVGPVKSIPNGPRGVDLDIIFYDDLKIDTRQPSHRLNFDNLEGELVVPHPRLTEREFVLRPLSDIIPEFVHPVTCKTVRIHLNELPDTTDGSVMHRVIPFPKLPLPEGTPVLHPLLDPVPPTLIHWTYQPISHPSTRRAGHRTQVMATLNVTPDSFSTSPDDHTANFPFDFARNAVACGAAMIDVGGYSTRPNADFVDTATEMERVVPAISAIRSGGCAQVDHTPISIDTFRWEVAEAAVNAGANCINDVCAFTGKNEDDGAREESIREMRRVARRNAVPVVMMHSRGDAGQNSDYGAYAYASVRGQVVEGVRVELGEKVSRAVEGPGGVRRWLVMVDPGVGFSKTVEGNLEVIRDAAAIVKDVRIGEGGAKGPNPLIGFPLLIGPSRKSFLGKLINSCSGRTTMAWERDWATAAAVSCAVQQGVLVVRVHDVQHLVDTVLVANALWG